jgi:hypothetical protein
MQPRASLILGAICCVVVPMGFALGRWSGSTAATVGGRPSESSPSSDRSLPQAGPAAKDSADFSAVTIENLGQVEFDHAFEMLRTAPKEALIAWTKRLEALPISPRHTAAITLFFKTVAQIDTKVAVDLALSIERAEPRWTAIGAIDVGAPLANLSEVARMYSGIDPMGQALVGSLISRWSLTDPEATARFLAAYSGTVTNEELAPFLGNWAARDPAAAMQWLANADAKRRSSRVYEEFYAGWMSKDRAAALQAIAMRSSEKVMKKAIRRATENLFMDSPDAAREFVLSLSNIAAQKEAVAQVTEHITRVVLGGADRIQIKPPEAAKWLATLPEELWHSEIGYVLDQWGFTDPPAVNAWLNQMPPQTKDRLLAEQCSAFNWNVPTTGFKAGLQISDRELREKTFREVLKEMNGAGREELLQKAELSADEAAEMQRILKRL